MNPDQHGRFAGVLFLDFVGTMNRHDDCGDQAVFMVGDRVVPRFEAAAVTALNRILATHDLGIVCVSTLRILPGYDIASIMEANGIDRARERYLGPTPNLCEISLEPFDTTSLRAAEILSWMESSGYTGPFAVIDDADIVGLDSGHFQPNKYVGLTSSMSNEVILHFARLAQPAADQTAYETRKTHLKRLRDEAAEVLQTARKNGSQRDYAEAVGAYVCAKEVLDLHYRTHLGPTPSRAERRLARLARYRR